MSAISVFMGIALRETSVLQGVITCRDTERVTFARTGPATIRIGGIYEPNVVFGNYLVGGRFFLDHFDTPLTTAVLSSVDEEYTGAASGFNSAVARTAGMIATALLGSVLGATGAALNGGFHVMTWICAAASLGASASALFLIRISSTDAPRR